MFQGESQRWVEIFWKSLSAPFQAWLEQHPILSWLASHPLWLLAIILLTLFLLSGLLRAVASLTEQFWLLLLRLPILMVQWVWQGSLLLLRPIRPKAEPSAPNRLAELLERLETLRQEEEDLMQEIKSLLSVQTQQNRQ
jgi:hypothetical protein